MRTAGLHSRVVRRSTGDITWRAPKKRAVVLPKLRRSGAKVVLDGFFFFSSRRRHTRCSRDWSSDVCSSDLEIAAIRGDFFAHHNRLEQAQPVLQEAAQAEPNLAFAHEALGYYHYRQQKLGKADRKSVV